MSCRRARRGSASAGRASRARLRVPVFTGMDEAAVVVDATGDRPGRGRSTVYARRSPWRVFLRGCAIVVGLLELAHLAQARTRVAPPWAPPSVQWNATRGRLPNYGLGEPGGFAIRAVDCLDWPPDGRTYCYCDLPLHSNAGCPGCVQLIATAVHAAHCCGSNAPVARLVAQRCVVCTAVCGSGASVHNWPRPARCILGTAPQIHISARGGGGRPAGRPPPVSISSLATER